MHILRVAPTTQYTLCGAVQLSVIEHHRGSVPSTFDMQCAVDLQVEALPLHSLQTDALMLYAWLALLL